MTSHAARLYALAAAVLVFFVAWAAIAARPWATAAPKQDPRLAALQVREQRVGAEALAVQRIVDRRWAVYRARLAERKRAIAAVGAANAARARQLASTPAPVTSSGTSSATTAAPSVRVVTLPPLTITRTS